MNKQITSIIKNKEKLKAIKEIMAKYGLKTTSSALLATCILLTNVSSEGLSKEKTETSSKQAPHIGETLIKKLIKEEQTKINDALVYVEPTYEEKIATILSTYNLTLEQLDICCAITIAEACDDGNNYAEATNVINTAYNRIISKTWVTCFGDNIYDQLTAPNQFIVYQNGRYKKYLGRTDLPGYQAVIDFLSNTNDNKPHNYLAFRSNQTEVAGSIMLVEGGNNYFSKLNKEDALEDFRILQSSEKLVLKRDLL